MGVKEGGAFLAEARKRLSLTQMGLSIAAGFDESGRQRLPYEQITRIERGTTENPPMNQLCVYGKVCRVSPNEIAVAYGYWDEPDAPTDNLALALEAASTLDKEMQEYLASVVFGTIATVEEQKSTGKVKAISKKQ